MSPAVQRQLEGFGRRLIRWRAELLLMRGGAVLLAGMALAGYADLFWRAGYAGRWAGFVALASLGGILLASLARGLRRRLTPEGLAAVMERAYPELDNHLINYVQFSRMGKPNPLVSAYIRGEIPVLHALPAKRMKNRRRHRQGLAALSGSALLLIAPVFVVGSTPWTTALRRMLNPLSSLRPVTLTQILSVTPGTTDMRQGDSAVLTVAVKGMRGHTVRLDYTPDDGRHTVYELGRLDGDQPQSFSHRIPRANTRFRYRFRAGDAEPSEWFTVTPRPPPALARIGAILTPPAYTRLPRLQADLTGQTPPVIPAGSQLRLQAVSTVPLETLEVSVAGSEPVPMRHDPELDLWELDLPVLKPGGFRFSGNDRYGQSLSEAVMVVYKEDLPPVIEIIAPQGRMVLPPGETPRIEFRVRDDYGVASVSIERMASGDEKAEGVAARQWEPAGAVDWLQVWSEDEASVRGGRSVVYRIVATDNADEPGVSRSAPVIFNAPSPERMADARDQLEAEGIAGLEKVIALQTENIEHCSLLEKTEGKNDSARWSVPTDRQREVRTLTRALLANPVKPFGGRTEAVNRLYADEMVLAIDALTRAAAAPPGADGPAAAESVRIQASILRQLQAAQRAVESARVDRRQSGVSAMLAALIAGQTDIQEAAPRTAPAGLPALAERQDVLAEDLTVFESACGRFAESVRANDAAFADLLETLARESRERRIREDMLLCAEQLDRRNAASATPLGGRAHESLLHLQGLLERVELQREANEQEAMIEALGQAREKVKRLEDLHTVMKESIDGIRGNANRDSEDFDVLVEEYLEVARKNKETLLSIPVDLHIFTDLNVGNELVEDVFAVFEEIEQVRNRETDDPKKALDIAYAKNLEALELMREMQDRCDDMELWLTDKAEMNKVTTEALDREEMPQEGVALGALAAQVEDLIGDLVDENEDAAEASDDGAVNHAMPDMPMGWDVLEGDISTFSGKGKSGNQRPDHKEQDGRSNVGRQGMSSGETSAGSGTINEGDDQIEERRTEDPVQSGMVQLDGEADTKATGGGKLGSGKADELGMEGGTRRLDSTEEGSWEGMAALMAQSADAVFAQASLKNVRVDSLRNAAHHLRQANDAIAGGDIARMTEHRKLALAALRKAKAELDAGPSAAIQLGKAPSIIEDAVQSGPDLAPPKYKDQVADYYKLLNEEF